MGLGGVAASLSLHTGLPQPQWQQHSKTCSGVLVPYTRHKLDTAGNLVGLGSALPASPSPGLCHREQGELVCSQGPHSHRIQQGQVLSSFDGQLSGGVVVDDFRDTVEWGAVLTQNIFLFGFGQFHVHKALVALQ